MSDPSLSYLPDGRHVCCICVEAFEHSELEPVEGEPGRVWDVCTQCWRDEQAAAVITPEQLALSRARYRALFEARS